MDSVKDLQRSWIARKAEISRYEAEEQLHLNSIDGLPDDLPDEWPAHLAEFKSANRSAIIGGVADSELDLVQNLLIRDRSVGALREVRFELNVCRRHLAAIEKTLPEEDRHHPVSQQEIGIRHLESLRLSGEILEWSVDENTIALYGATLVASVLITRADSTTKRRIMSVTEDGIVTFVHSSISV